MIKTNDTPPKKKKIIYLYINLYIYINEFIYEKEIGQSLKGRGARLGENAHMYIYG